MNYVVNIYLMFKKYYLYSYLIYTICFSDNQGKSEKVGERE